MITRQDYMNNSNILHHAYYSQFSPILNADKVKQFGKKLFKENAMLFGSDNYITLQHWDAFGLRMDINALREAGDYLTKAGAVSIKKAAVLDYLIRSNHYKYAVTWIKKVGDFERHHTEFFTNHASAFEFYESLTVSVKGVYVIHAEVGEVEGVNISGNFFNGEAIGLDAQLKNIVNTVKNKEG